MHPDAHVTFDQILEEQLQDPEFRVEWERLAPARAIANSLIRYRIDNGLTQTGLGRRLGMSQPGIARLESGDHLPTLQTLLKLTEALGLEILVTMSPQELGKDCLRSEVRQPIVNEQFTTPGGASMTIAIR
jgi:DNA-binding XRE family transcriptional regulator